MTGWDEQRAREAIARYGERLLEDGLTRHTGGNVSVRVDNDRFAISPSGVPYPEVDPSAVPVVTTEGELVDGVNEPSSETPMHATVYRERPDAGGIVHTHSPFASAYATAGRPIEPAYYLVALVGDRVPVSAYEMPGSWELGERAVAALEDRNGVLLRNHGVLTVGSTIEDAYEVAVQLEHVAEVTYRAEHLGGPEILSADDVRDLVEYFD
ncbi:class II aldolase/adducin family protein [Halobacteria archaeon AArc-m2/3/4]|uniref:Class II aldolase/adducin family protein n=1 Tax=Natronoglomus mannanivorans TaxID=2979990 RepID=A0ABT2QKI4_9EURY|nr:class II aldolase/adducin family protein [Halobacteria archaeon AArc-m2/3/4]